MTDADPPPRVLCEACGEPITYTGGTRYHGQATIAVGMATEGGKYVCGCPETPQQWEIRIDSPQPESADDPTWMHPDGCRCEECLHG